MEQVESQVIEKLRILPRHKQLEVLDFVEFLASRATPPTQAFTTNQTTEISFAQAAGQYIGSVEGPGDLSTNPEYMKGYGQ